MDFKKFTVSTRLAFAFGMVLSISLIAAVLSLSKLSSIQENLRDIVQDNNVKVKLNNDMADAIHIVTRVMRSVVLLNEKAEKDAEMVKIVKAREDYDKAWADLEKFAASPTGKVIRAKIVAAKELARPLNNRVVELGMASKDDEAKLILFKEANPATQKWQDALAENIAFQQTHSEQQFLEAEADYAQAKFLLIAANALSIGLAILLGWLVTRSITSQLGVSQPPQLSWPRQWPMATLACTSPCAPTIATA